MAVVRPYALGGTTTVAELTVRTGADIDGTTLVVNDATDKVGIGLSNPKTKLTVDGSITLKEQAAADADTAAYGQIWTKTATPCELYFTTDAGDDIQLTTGSSTPGTGDITEVTAGTGLSGGGTTGAVTLNVEASQTGVTALGTIATGVWEGTAVASAYLDADTAHLSGVQSFTGAKTFTANVTLPNNVYVGKSIFHTEDTNTRLHFFNTNDTISLEVATFDFLRCVEDGTSSESVFNFSGHANIDFRVCGDTESHLLYVDAGNERVSIGDSTDAPTATLEVTNHASAGATGVPLVQLNNNDVDKKALDIKADNTGSVVASITNGAVNNSPVLVVESTAAETNALVELVNSNASADKPPILKFAKINGAADDYDIATISFNGENDAGTPEPIEYAKIEVTASDVTDGDEGGQIKISVMSGGTAGTAAMTEALKIGREDTAAGAGGFALMMNDQNADLDVKIRSVNNNNMFFMNAATDRIGINKSATTSTFHINGSFCQEIVNQTTGTLAITEAHSTITCDTSGGNVECDLPAISGITGRRYTFIKIHASNSMIIDPNGSELIFISAAPSGGAAVTRNDNGSVLTLICTSVGWNVLSDFVPA